MDKNNIFFEAISIILVQLASILPKLITALLIWYLGKYILSLIAALVKKFNINKTKLDDKATQMFINLVEMSGRLILVLIILDFLGIGRTIIAALAQGVTYAIAIALGLSFGKALEKDVAKFVENFRKLFFKE